jgi:adenosylcobinamide-GDP ribazoletransferase
MFADLRRALGLLTVLPVRAPISDTTSPGRAMAYYPLVGAVIGGILAGIAALLHWSGLTTSVPLLSAAIVLALWGGLTGGLHLDGWADCCDALFVPVDRERRLEIMKDPRLGGFGAVGLVLLLLVKLAALQGVLGKPHSLLSLVAVVAVARLGAVVVAYAFPSARPGGMGDYFRRGLSWRGLSVCAVIALAAAAPLLWRGAVVWAAVAVACVLLASLAKARLGGLTGDVYGAVVELGETLALVVLCFL